MKKNVNKKLKIGIISILIVLIGIISFNLSNVVKHPSFEEQTTLVYTYNNKVTSEYKVYVKPNKLYTTNPLEEGKLYITEFVDYINTSFNYEFTGERDADLKGNYTIIAKVQGFTGEGEKIINIWEKDFPIIDKKSFTTKDSSKSIKEDIRINLDEYNTFAKEIIETSKINCQTALTIYMDINIEGETDKGRIEETITPNIVIPLNTSMFQISGNTEIEKPGAIEETKQIQLPINKKQVIFYGIIIGILLIGIILLVFFTEGVSVAKDPLEKMLKKIFKKHGDRLVALNSDYTIEGSINMVKSIDDLVKIADEVGKPIMYKYSYNYNEIRKFYVVHENEVYIFDIDKMINNKEVNFNNKEISGKVAKQDIG